MSAFDNAALPLRIAGARPEGYRQDVAELLTWVGLRSRMHAMPATLAGGEKQRLAIARAVLARPELIVADEPTGSLDFATGATVMDLMFDLNREAGTTLVLVTHDRAIAARCERQLRIEAGRVEPTLAVV